jgi:hypothetical protein
MDENLLIQLQLSDRSTEILENGSFDAWSGGAPIGWTPVVSGGSTVTEETTDLRPGAPGGSSAVRFTYDATPGTARIHQTKTFIKEAWYYLKFWYKCNSFSSSENWSIRIRDAAANIYLQDDLKTWNSAINDIFIPCSDNWTYFEIKGLLMHPDYSSYFIGLGNGNTITSDYIIVDDIEIKLDTTFCAFEQISWNDAQWVKNIASASISIQDNSAYRGDREQSGLSVSLNDYPGKYFRGILQNRDTNVIIGNGAIVRKADGTKKSDYVITDWSKPEEIITFKLGDGYAELENNTTPPQITEECFPFAPEATLDNYINHFSGQFQINPSTPSAAGEKDYLVAWRVKDRVVSTTDGRYLIGRSIQNIVVWGGGQDFQYCIDSDGNDRTANCTLITPTATDPYHYVDLASSIADVEFIKVHFKYPAISVETMIEEIGKLLFSNFEFDISDINLLLGWGGRHYNKSNPGAQDHTDPHFVIDKSTKYIDILNQLCKAFNMSYYISADRKIVFRISGYNAFYDSAEATQLQPNVSSAFISLNDKGEYSELTNYVNMSWGYYDGSNAKQMPFQNFESQKRRNDVKDEPIDAPFFPANLSISKRFAFQTAKLLMIDKFDTQKEVSFDIVPRSVVEDLTPLHILKFKHDNFNDDEYHYMQIRRMNFQYPGNSAIVDFIDVSHIAEIDTNCTFLLQSNDENGSLIYLDRSANGFHWIDNNNNDTQHDNTYPLFGKTSIKNSSSSPDIRTGLFSYLSYLHIFAALLANDFNSSQLSIWVRFDNSGNQEVIASQYVDANNYWALLKNTSDNIRILVVTGGITRLDLAGGGGIMANGKWHHVLFYRTDSRAALYIDGTQRANSTNSLNYTFNSEWHFMNDGNSGNYMDGNIQDIYIALNYASFLEERETGWFDCNPDAGNTDTYIVPYGLMSNFWQRYWIDF